MLHTTYSTLQLHVGKPLIPSVSWIHFRLFRCCAICLCLVPHFTHLLYQGFLFSTILMLQCSLNSPIYLFFPFNIHWAPSLFPFIRKSVGSQCLFSLVSFSFHNGISSCPVPSHSMLTPSIGSCFPLPQNTLFSVINYLGINNLGCLYHECANSVGNQAGTGGSCCYFNYGSCQRIARPLICYRDA